MVMSLRLQCAAGFSYLANVPYRTILAIELSVPPACETCEAVSVPSPGDATPPLPDRGPLLLHPLREFAPPHLLVPIMLKRRRLYPSRCIVVGTHHAEASLLVPTTLYRCWCPPR